MSKDQTVSEKAKHVLTDSAYDAGIPKDYIVVDDENSPHGVPESPLIVGNLPADRVTRWVTDPNDPRIMGAAADFSSAQQNGYRRVELDEVSSNPYAADKLYIKAYTAKDGFVYYNGAVLMIAYREAVEKRQMLSYLRGKTQMEAQFKRESADGLLVTQGELRAGDLRAEQN